MPTPKKPNPRSTGKIKPGSGINKPLPGDRYAKKSDKKAAAFGTMPKMTAAEAKKADANKKKALSEYEKKHPIKGGLARVGRDAEKARKKLSSDETVEKVFGYNIARKK